jgi:hypothetical protein
VKEISTLKKNKKQIARRFFSSILLKLPGILEGGDAEVPFDVLLGYTWEELGKKNKTNN